VLRLTNRSSPLPLIVSRLRRPRVAMYPLTSGGSIELAIVSFDGLADADFDGLFGSE
jgi:hypothetical protein